MAVVVLVHGIAQEQSTADALEQHWLPALAGGLRAVGRSSLADRLWRDRSLPNGIDARMAYYGGLFVSPNYQGVGQVSKTEELQFMESLARLWLVRASDRTAEGEQRGLAAAELRYICGRGVAEEMGRGAVVRSAIGSSVDYGGLRRLG